MACKILHKGQTEKHASTDEPSDRSYEDALLDVQLTSFFRSEYGKQEPPTGVFPRIVQAIRVHRERQEKLASVGMFARWRGVAGEKLAAAYRFGARADSGRVLSGGLVTALLLIAALPSLSNALSSSNMGTLYGTYFQAFSQNGSAAPTQYPTSGNETGSIGTVVAPRQATTPTNSTGDGGQAASPVGAYISPGRIYEERLFRTEQRTGEDLLSPEESRSSSQQNTGKSNVVEEQDTEQYQRPALGQD
jgi:hypothetical protein